MRHSLPTLESDPFTANIHFSDRIPGGVSGEVSALDLRDMNDDLLHDYRAAADPLVALFQYYLASLELMCAVVHDRYWDASQHLMEHSFDLACGYNDMLFLIKHEMCPWILRAQACNVMTALYVDRAPFLEVATVNSIRTWTKLHESVADEKLRKDEPYNFLPENLRPPQGFRELKQHCLEQLDKCSNVDADATGQASILKSTVPSVVTLYSKCTKALTFQQCEREWNGTDSLFTAPGGHVLAHRAAWGVSPVRRPLPLQRALL